MVNRKPLAQLAFDRVKTTIFGSKRFEDSYEIVVFGSTAVGLQRQDSDIDVLCVSNEHFKLKTNNLDLIVMPVELSDNDIWLNSELASHIAEYGIWIKGASQWRSKVQIGHAAIECKRRRIAAFVRALPDSWLTLDEGFRVKYSTKLRRETQRLLLMERGTPVPPTKILDSFWNSISRSPHEIHDRLLRFTTSSHCSFVNDLFARIDRSFTFQEANEISIRQSVR